MISSGEAKGNEAVAAVLIANGADTEARKVDETTPLHAAAAKGHASVVELLVANGADVNARGGVFPPTTARGGRAFASIHSAGRMGHFDIVDLLRALGATGPTIKPVSDLLASADAREGETVFLSNCLVCHSIEKGGSADVGPNLWGVLGRNKASVEDFSYSAAFVRLVGTWTIAEFNAFIGSPTDYIPGTLMLSDGAKDAAQRANLIAFLRQNSDDPPPFRRQ